tara:strand:- start:224 stop:1240 length:1017 start_codon:yes stop_codon:yes gene_type:complete
MSKAAELAALIGSQSSLSNRNIIINGAMQVAQRGTSETSVTSNGYKQAPDRWRVAGSATGTFGTWSVSQSTDVPSGEGFGESYKLECTTADASLAASDNLTLQHRIEGQNLQQLSKGTSNAKSVTLSFWVKSNKTGTYIAELRDQDNSRVYGQQYTILASNTWEKKTLTYSGDTTGSLDNDNLDSLRVLFFLLAGTDFTSGTLPNAWATSTNANRAVGQVNIADTIGNEWYITGIQLELGEQATPFEHRSYGEELALCQRYYYQPTTRYYSGANTNDAHRNFVSFPCTMRSAPVTTLPSVSAGTIGQIWTGAEAFNYEVTANRPGIGITSPFKFDSEL